MTWVLEGRFECDGCDRRSIATALGVDSASELACPTTRVRVGDRLSEVIANADYEALLESKGKVIASFDRRRDRIRELVESAASDLGGEARIESDLLDEVTALVEYPAPVLGRFDVDFLQLPVEVLVTTMQENQKYFEILKKIFLIVIVYNFLQLYTTEAILGKTTNVQQC